MNPAEHYILNQVEPYKSILLHLQLIIEETVKETELKFKWKIPCYYIGKTPFCYLNQSKDYVDLGFWNSAYLTINTEYLTTANRKVIKSLRYKTLTDINTSILIEILNDAYSVKDKNFWKN